MTTPEGVAMGLDPISLDETNAQAELLRRTDTKYLASAEVVERLLIGVASSYRALEIDGRRSFRYRSRYLDSSDLRTFHWHVQGRRRRFKCRIRHYLDSGDQLLEVKARGARGETMKYRTPCTDHVSRQDRTDFIGDCLAEAYGTQLDIALAPVLDVEYLRMTLVSRDGRERVTLDHGLSFRDLASGSEYAMHDGDWIIETKSVRGGGAVDLALRSAKVRPVSVSKYVLGLALTNPELRVNQYLGIMRVLSSHEPPQEDFTPQSPIMSAWVA
jgi:hypothetical protein